MVGEISLVPLTKLLIFLPVSSSMIPESDSVLLWTTTYSPSADQIN